jgi:hypothetical protein
MAERPQWVQQDLYGALIEARRCRTSPRGYLATVKSGWASAVLVGAPLHREGGGQPPDRNGVTRPFLTLDSRIMPGSGTPTQRPRNCRSCLPQ